MKEANRITPNQTDIAYLQIRRWIKENQEKDVCKSKDSILNTIAKRRYDSVADLFDKNVVIYKGEMTDIAEKYSFDKNEYKKLFQKQDKKNEMLETIASKINFNT